MPSDKKAKSLKKKYSSFFITRRDIPEPEPEPEDRVEGIYPLLDEFKISLVETDPVPRNMDASMLQKEVNAVTATVISALVIYAAASQALT